MPGPHAGLCVTSARKTRVPVCQRPSSRGGRPGRRGRGRRTELGADEDHGRAADPTRSDELDRPLVDGRGGLTRASGAGSQGPTAAQRAHTESALVSSSHLFSEQETTQAANVRRPHLARDVLETRRLIGTDASEVSVRRTTKTTHTGREGGRTDRDEAEADEEDVRLRVRQRPQAVVVLLTCSPSRA